MPDLPVWTGNPAELPAEGVQFLYSDRRYVWHQCHCGNEFCKRPIVVDLETEEESSAMTTRARGTNQGNPLYDVLLKAGVLTIDKLVEIEPMGPLALLVLMPEFDEFDRLYEAEGNELLKRTGIEQLQFEAFQVYRP